MNPVEEVVSPFECEDAMTVIESEPEHVPSLVEDLLLKTGISILVGKPKVGKSSMARQLAVAVAEGRSFLGHNVISGDVLYFILEGPKGVVAQHFHKLGYTGTKGTIRIVHQMMPYEGELGLQKLEATLAANPKTVLVIIDPATKFLRLPDSDKNDIVSVAIEKLEAVAKKVGVHVQMLAHAKKKATDDVGDSLLGSTGFRAAADTNLFLVKVGNDRVLSTEQRWGTALEPTVVMYDAERGEMNLGKSVDEIQSAAEERKARKTRERIEADIIAVVAELHSPTHADVVSKVKGNAMAKLEVLNSLVERKLLVKSGAGTRGEPTCYSLNVPEAVDVEHKEDTQSQTESFMERFR